MKLFRNAALVFLGVLTLTLAGSEPDRATSSAVTELGTTAQDLYFSALDARAALDYERALRLLQESWEADPAFLPAAAEAMWFMGGDYPTRGSEQAIESLLSTLGKEDSACFRQVALHASGRAFMPERVAGTTDEDHSCEVWSVVLGGQPFPQDQEQRDSLLRAIEGLLDTHPENHHWLMGTYARLLMARGAEDRLLHLTADLLSTLEHPIQRAKAFGWRMRALHMTGHHDEALALEQDWDGATESAAPGVRVEFLGAMFHPPAPPDEQVAAHMRERDATAQAELLALSAGGPPSLRVRTEVGWATELIDRGRLEESVRWWDRLEGFADSLQHRGLHPAGLRTVVTVRRGRALVMLGRHELAERDLTEASRLARETGDVRWEVEAEHNLLHLYESLGRNAEALEAGRAFVERTAALGALERRMMSHHDLGLFLQRRGLIEEARTNFRAMVSIIDSLGSLHVYAGEFFEMTGDLEMARAYYHRALEVGGRELSALMRLSEALGEFEAAERYARRADLLIPNYPEQAPLLPGLLARNGRSREALLEFDHARAEAARDGQLGAWVGLTVELAEMELDRGLPAIAAPLADSAAEAADRLGLKEMAVRARGLSGLAAVVVGTDRSEGLDRLRTAARDARTLALPALQAELNTWYGDGLLRTGKVSEGFSALARSSELIDSLASSLVMDPARAAYRASHVDISNRALGAALEVGGDQAIDRYVEWSQRRKGRGLVGMDTERAVDRRVVTAAAVELSNGDGAVVSDPLAFGRYTEALRRLGFESEEVSRVSAASIQRAVGPDRAVIDYAVLDDRVAALVVTSEGPSLHLLPVRPDSLSAQVERLRTRMAPRVGSAVDLSRASFDAALAASLYQALITPLESKLVSRLRLTIVPDGPLHALPFDALVAAVKDASPSGTVYLLERWETNIAPDLAAAASESARTPAGPAVAFTTTTEASLLPGAEKEIDSFQRAFEGVGARTFEGSGATEAAVREWAPGAAVLHFAVHAYPSDREPAFARLSLAPSQADDGQLHAYEIGELMLPGALVVLSACETATGRIAEGEGMLSLGRAFLRAGAAEVLGTLWPIGEATSELMESFYSKLAEGMPPSTAIRFAKLELLRGTRHPQPFHWASFVLVTAGS